MGKRYVAHSDTCGCVRCAKQWDSDYPQVVYDTIEDPMYREDGTHIDEPPLDWDDDDDDF